MVSQRVCTHELHPKLQETNALADAESCFCDGTRFNDMHTVQKLMHACMVQ